MNFFLSLSHDRSYFGFPLTPTVTLTCHLLQAKGAEFESYYFTRDMAVFGFTEAVRTPPGFLYPRSPSIRRYCLFQVTTSTAMQRTPDP